MNSHLAKLLVILALAAAPYAGLAAPRVDERPDEKGAPASSNTGDEKGEGNKGDKSGDRSGEKTGKDSDKGDTSGSGSGGADDQNKLTPKRQESVVQGATILVGDRALTGPSSTVEKRGSRAFLPVVGIARLLGDSVTVNLVTRTVDVQRQTGVTAVFSAPLNQVLENGAVVLVVAESADITFPPNAEELMLPVEIISALLDVSVIVESGGRTVRVRRGQARADVRDGGGHGSFDLYQTDYTINVNKYSSSFSHYSSVRTTGRIGEGRFDLNASFDGGGSQSPLIYRRGSFSYERPNGQRFIGGDFGTGTDMQFIGTLLRGLWVETPYRGMQVKSFFGRAVSTPTAPSIIAGDPAFPGVPIDANPIDRAQTELQYKTTVLGSYVTWGSPVANRATSPLVISSGAMYFSGPDARGEMASGSIRSSSTRNQLQADAGFGTFSGFSNDGRGVSGPAAFADVSDLFQATPALSFQGRYTYIGPNYLSPQSGGAYVPMQMWNAGMSWRPVSWFGASVNRMSRKELFGLNERDSSLNGSISITPGNFLPTVFITRMESKSSVSGPSSYMLVNLTKEFSRLRLFSNVTRIKAPDIKSLFLSTVVPPSTAVTVGGIVRLNQNNSIQVSQFAGSGGTMGGSYDWNTSSFLKKRLVLGTGFGFTKSGTTTSYDQRVMATLELPHHQILQINYAKSKFGDQLLIQLRGQLFSSKRAAVAINAPISEMRSFGALYGKVYQDVNLNGRLDPGVDRPISGVQVRVDGSHFAQTDGSGDFRVENVSAGEHKVYLDLTTVRADLTLIDNAQQTAVMRAGRDSIVDFRLVRTGRMRGTVWLDENGNGVRDDDEQGLADVRVITSSGRDTLTDEKGEFVIGDLPPGEHTVLIDERTLPNNSRSKQGSFPVTIQAGKETPNVNLPVMPKPVEVQVKTFPVAKSGQ
jgi:hypothetical protein